MVTAKEPPAVTQEHHAYACTLNQGSEPRYLAWVTEISDPSKDSQRLLVVGDHYLYIVKKSGWSKVGLGGSIKVTEKGHLFKLQQFSLYNHEQRNRGVVTVAFDSFSLRFLHIGPALIHHLWAAVMSISYQFPNSLLPELSEDMVTMLTGIDDPRARQSPSAGHKKTYLAMCTQEEIVPREAVMDHLEQVLGALSPGSQPGEHHGKEFELDLYTYVAFRTFSQTFREHSENTY
jgi:hypothetical protein